MLDAGAIHPSQSPWCNVVVLVQKKDGSLCFCVDFHRLNTHTKKDSYPLPRIQEVLESMAGTVHFSMSRFWQVKVAPESQQNTAFTVGNLGFYKFTPVPFGPCNAPMTFQHLMQNTLEELNLTYCIIYLDDVIVFGHTEEERLEHLHIMFEHFREFNLNLKPSKCSFFMSEIVYLAHHISHKGIHPSRENVHVVEEFPMLETFTQVCTFCGLAGHYRHFIKGFAHISRPLYDVLGKEVSMDLVQLFPEAWEMIRILKEKIQSAPMLVFPDFDKPFFLETDPSKEGLGVVLSQKRMMGATILSLLEVAPLHQRSKIITALSLNFSLFSGASRSISRSTLLMHPLVRTDNNPLTYVLTTPNHDAMGHRWVGVLASFEFALDYQKVADNGVADALSQVPICHNHEMVWSLMEGAIVGAAD